MEKHIGETLSGEIIASDVFNERGVLLLKAGTALNNNLKSLLRKHHVTMVLIQGGLTA